MQRPQKKAGSTVAEIEKYSSVAVFILVAVGLPAALLLGSYLFSFLGIRPVGREDGPAKRESYESGAEPIGQAWGRFNIRYYFFALLYLLFAVEAIFLFPWAIRLKHLGYEGLIAMFVFLGIQIAGFIYEWKRGGLEWE
jgi:NADH-quinone oxidoreductase subunit A